MSGAFKKRAVCVNYFVRNERKKAVRFKGKQKVLSSFSCLTLLFYHCVTIEDTVCLSYQNDALLLKQTNYIYAVHRPQHTQTSVWVKTSCCRRVMQLHPKCIGLLTSWGHQTDYDGGGGRWALNQHGNQDSHHEPSHRVRQHRIVLEDVPCHFAWLNMPPTHRRAQT